MTAPVQHAVLLAAGLFAVGGLGLLVRRNLLFTLASIEIMLNAAGLAFVAAGARHGSPDGQVVFLLILTVTAAEVAVALALVYRLHRNEGTVDGDRLAGGGR